MKKIENFGAIIMCRDNEDVIERMLDSIIDHVDSICMCDTGSKDNTINILNRYKKDFEAKGKEFLIYFDEWKNFGHNRTLSMKHARNMNVKYFMLIDTDETAEFEDGFLDEIYTNNYDYYDYIVSSDNLIYNRYGIFRNDRNWKWVGYAHNQVLLENATRSVTDKIKIKLYPHTQYSGDHNLRSIKLLEEEISDNKRDGIDNKRPYFYLAQLYSDGGRYKDAINAFNHTLTECDNNNCGANVGYFSNYKSGELLLQSDQPELGIKRLLRAFELQPYRAEPLYILGKYYRENGNYYTSELMLRKAITIPQPTHGFFIKPHIYQYLIKFELSITLFYTKNKLESEKYMKELTKMDLPKHISDRNRINMTYF
jgi:tetratricopeptide (TPR) repeat protein